MGTKRSESGYQNIGESKSVFDSQIQRGPDSDQKANPTGVAKEMQEAEDSRGSPVFLLEDWKTARKISNSYFLSRVSALNKSTRTVMVTLNDEQNVNNDDFRSWEGYSAVESLRKEVYGAVNLQHPLWCTGHKICLMQKEKKLKNLKVLELKRISVTLSPTTSGAIKEK